MAPASHSPTNKRLRPSGPRIIWLLPHEHGAYGQLLFPTSAALLLRFSCSGAWLAAAFFLAFALHESLLILIGQRGGRARQLYARRAPLQAGILALFALVCLLQAISRSGPPARWALLLPAALATLMGALIAAAKERTTAGELIAAATLSSCSFPVLIAGGGSLAGSAAFWLVWLVTLLSATLSVRGVIVWARHRQSHLLRAGLLLAGLSLLACGLLQSPFRLPRLLWLSLLPAGLVCSWLLLRTPSPRHLRRIGWTWMITSLAVLLLFVTLIQPR